MNLLVSPTQRFRNVETHHPVSTYRHSSYADIISEKTRNAQDLHETRTVLALERAAACVAQLIPIGSEPSGIPVADTCLEVRLKQSTGASPVQPYDCHRSVHRCLSAICTGIMNTCRAWHLISKERHTGLTWVLIHPGTMALLVSSYSDSELKEKNANTILSSAWLKGYKSSSEYLFRA